MKEAFSILSGALFFIGYGFYIRSILQKKTKPIKATWIVFAVLSTIIIAGMYVKDTVNGQILANTIGSWAVVPLTFKYGLPGWTRRDKFCLGGAGFGIVLWQILGDPVIGIVVSLVVMFVGAIPTFVSAWKDPSREDKLAWTIFWISCVCAVIAIRRWTLADASQPITFSVIESTMMYLLYIRSRWGIKGVQE